MDYKKEIIKCINDISGKYSTYEVFADWVKMQALAISQSVWHMESREKEYLDIVKKYNADEIKMLSNMNAMLTMAFDEKMDDVLGSIYMSKEMGSNKLGQFFTPYHLCKMMAELQDLEELKEKEYILVNEPSTGAGANIIAFCEHVKKNGYNYQTQLSVIAQDLDYKAVYMSYVQFSLLGIPALVVQGNTLFKPYNFESVINKNVFITPMYMLNNHIQRKT